MTTTRRAGSLAVVAALAVSLVGCSMDAVIWGAEGARVIETTEELIRAVESNSAPAVCTDSKADLGEPPDWAGLSAGEPEHFHAEYWPEQADLDPAWSINLELGGEGATPGRVFPGDVFYRETEDGLCVVDIAWWTVEQ